MSTNRNPDAYDPAHDPTIMGNDAPRHELASSAREDPAAVDESGAASKIGEAAGGLSGALTGAAIGSVGGPVGMLIGGIAGAVGGWWAGRAIAVAATHFGEEEDRRYRARHASEGDRGRTYEDVRAVYQIGHLASLNPEYAGRDFEEIESDLRHGWNGEAREQFGEWTEVRTYARDAYADARSRRVIGPDAERPIDVERDDASDDESGVELTEAADPDAFGDNTAITGYAGGLTDADSDAMRPEADR
jgi:hypothetical protein